MMRWVAILMSFLILLTSLRDLATYINFYLNQEYIAQNLCENIDKPQLMCSGKCILSDSLVENHKKESDKALASLLKERTIFVLPTIVNIQNSLTSLPFNKDSIAYKANFYKFEYLEEVFHPPSLLS